MRRKSLPILKKGAEFDLLKARKGTFRRWDHQLLQEMYVVKVKNKANSKNRWDIFDVIEAVPGAKPTREILGQSALHRK